MKRWRNLWQTRPESGRGYSAVLAAALCCMIAVGAAAPANAADWPMYRHDGARSGITPEAVTPPLAPHWVFQPRYAPEPAWPPPKDYPVEGILELPRNRFDDVFHVAAAGGLVYFGSSADNKVYALDAATGKVRWEFFTGGPVRTAPTVWKSRVFAASDDGWVYCLRAADGSVVWKLRAAAGSQRLLGNGKMISLWPVRTDVLVDNDIAYFAAGIFPSEGVCLYAVRASDGTVLWKNDWAADETRSSISPQGYLLASSKMLFAPMGRISPAAFDRADGTFRYFAYFGKNIGGSYALVADEKVYTGTTEIVAHSASTHRERFAYFSGRKIIVAKDAYYVLSERDMTALDRVAYPRASNRRRSLLGQRSRVDRDLRAPKSVLRRQQAALKQEQKKLDALKKKLDVLNKTPQPDPKAVDALMAQVNAQAKRGEGATRALDAAKAKAAPLQEKRAKLTEQIKGAMAALKATVRWRTPCDSSSSLIMAGGVLFAGGKGKVLAFDAADGKLLWTGQVDGDARGLAAASGRLLVSTDKGTIHCFGQPRAEKPTVVTQPANPNPFPKDALTPLFEQAAEAILEHSRVEGGYALVLGVGTGRLAYELAKRTSLKVYAVDPDPAKVAAVRKVLDAAGLYGKRIVVEQAPPDRIPYADYFADLIVSEQALLGGKLPFDLKDARRMLKPCGGVLCIGQPPAAKGLVQELKAGDLERFAKATGDEGAEVLTKSGRWVRLVRGPLEGAGKWTHQYGTPGNIASSTDQLVECPLGLLWFGEPGPRRVINRHEQAPAPLVLGHRMFIQGEHVILCYDVYNGRKLWERKIQGARRTRVSREASNLALNEDTLFVAVADKCLALDVRTGQTKATHAVPPAADGKPRRWGYVAVVGDLLYGSSTRRGYRPVG